MRNSFRMAFVDNPGGCFVAQIVGGSLMSAVNLDAISYKTSRGPDRG